MIIILFARTQGKLIMENMQSCYSLTMSYYFFGHSSSTVVGQEEETGILTGLADYVRAQAPHALGMPSDDYDHYYKPPWATSRDLEQKHRDISQEIGISLKGKERMFAQKTSFMERSVPNAHFESLQGTGER